jgi:hypothetical protein
MTDVYGRLLDRIGLLSEGEVAAVLQACMLVRQMPERLQLLEQQHASERERYEKFANVAGEYFEAIRKMHLTYLDVINTALAKLEE